jgi:hypothetical protein
LGFKYVNGDSMGGLIVVVPYWCLVPLNGVVAAIPWWPLRAKRFSLGTLLIVMTLAAVIGLVLASLIRLPPPLTVGEVAPGAE